MTPDKVWEIYDKTKWFVSNTGEVMHLRYPLTKKPWLSSNGYLKIAYRESKTRCVELFVHRMVAELFVPGDITLTVNHIDGDKLNNHPDNLEWITGSENCSHAHKIGLVLQHGEDNHQAKLTEADVKKICYLLDQGYKQSSIAFQFKIDTSTVSYINTGKRWNQLTNRKEKA